MQLMIDLETMGTSPRTAVMSMAAMPFELGGPVQGIELAKACSFYRRIDLRGQQRDLNADTLYWWLGRSDEARKDVVEGEKVSLVAALIDFRNWFNDLHAHGPFEGVWSHGASFDLALLADAYKQYHLENPIDYRHERCTRTVYALFGDYRKELSTGTHHNALDDAYVQILALRRALEEIK